MTAWLCLGSNLDNPEEQLNKALEYLREKCFVQVLREGKIQTSKAYGIEDQPDFANQIIQIDTKLNPHELLIFLKNAEVELGRELSYRWGPRCIDLDIIFYENQQVRTNELTIPHPGVLEREYLAKLLNEFMPDYIHPVTNQTISSIYTNLITKGDTQ